MDENSRLSGVLGPCVGTTVERWPEKEKQYMTQSTRSKEQVNSAHCSTIKKNAVHTFFWNILRGSWLSSKLRAFHFQLRRRWRAVDNDRYAMIHARKPELKSEPTWKIYSVKSYPEIGVKGQRWPAVFPGPLHEGRADRNDEGLGSRLRPIIRLLRSCNNEICLGVGFALCVIKALRLARIERCSGTVVTLVLLPSLKTTAPSDTNRGKWVILRWQTNKETTWHEHFAAVT